MKRSRVTLPEEREADLRWEPPGMSVRRRSLLRVDIQQDTPADVSSVDVDGRPVTAEREFVVSSCRIVRWTTRNKVVPRKQAPFALEVVEGAFMISRRIGV